MKKKLKKKKNKPRYLSPEEAQLALAMAEGFKNFESTI